MDMDHRPLHDSAQGPLPIHGGVDGGGLEVAAEPLRKAHSGLIQAHEQERLRIARELHDGFAQRIALVSLELMTLAKDTTPSDIRERLEQLSLRVGESPVREGAAAIMTTITKSTTATNGRRVHELRKILEERRRELMCQVQDKIRDGRRDHTKEGEVLDEVESSEVDTQEDIGFALIQMQAETLKKVNAALRRLGEGTYGECLECGGEIPEARLRALPFAMRCKHCEEAREGAELRERTRRRHGSHTLLADMVS